MLREACRQLSTWLDEGRGPAQIAVNVSAVQPCRGDLLGSVRAALDASGLAPARLELELTESSLMLDRERALDTIAALRALGCHAMQGNRMSRPLPQEEMSAWLTRDLKR